MNSTPYTVEAEAEPVKEKSAEDIAWAKQREFLTQDRGFEMMVRASTAVLKPDTLNRLCTVKEPEKDENERLRQRAKSALVRGAPMGPRSVEHHTEITGHVVGLKWEKTKKPLVFGRTLPKEARRFAFGQKKVSLPRHDENYKARRLRSATGHTRRAFAHNSYDSSQITTRRAESAQIGNRMRRDARLKLVAPNKLSKGESERMLRKLTNHGDNGGGVHARHELDRMQFYQWAGSM